MKKNEAAKERQRKKTIVISLGGSIICPDKVDTTFLRNFVEILKLQKDKRIIVITGGGAFCRNYIAAVDTAADRKRKTLASLTIIKDNLGISITKINALLLQSMCKAAKLPVHSKLIGNPQQKINWGNAGIAFGAGYKPGHSTDYDAVLAALANGATTVINLTNIDHVYTKDPRKYRTAKPLNKLTWEEYKRVLGIKQWSAGLHTPFDPFASALAQRKKLQVIIADGRKSGVLRKIISDHQVGTRIGPL